jgi:hypothetical protein
MINIDKPLERAPDKSTKKLTSYPTIRIAELKRIDASITGTTSIEGLISRFSRGGPNASADRHVRECLQFMEAVDLLIDDGTGAVTPINDTRFPQPETSFELRLLHHLRKQEGQQEHFWRIQEILIREDVRTIDEAQLFTNIKRELSYEFSWTEEKLRAWRNIAVQLGMISYSDEEGIVSSPSRALMYEILRLYTDQSESDDLSEALQWIEQHFLFCFTNRAGTPTLNPGIADVLESMGTDGVLELRSMADAQNEVTFPPTWRRAQSRTLKSFKLTDEPTRTAAYAYPLDHHSFVMEGAL